MDVTLDGERLTEVEISELLAKSNGDGVFQLLWDIFEIKNWRRSSSRREPLSRRITVQGPAESRRAGK
jgi:hypothetical protein